MVISYSGVCDICETVARFRSKSDWFRDHLLCQNCGSVPRERALMRVVREFFPDFSQRTIHESSPIERGVSARLARECGDYGCSYYFPDVPLGQINNQTNDRWENLEQLTFLDDTFDLFVTQDVIEHVYNPEAAFQQIVRVLKPGGAHIFTVPLVNKSRATRRRASIFRIGRNRSPYGANLS